MLFSVFRKSGLIVEMMKNKQIPQLRLMIFFMLIKLQPSISHNDSAIQSHLQLTHPAANPETPPASRKPFDLQLVCFSHAKIFYLPYTLHKPCGINAGKN